MSKSSDETRVLIFAKARVPLLGGILMAAILFALGAWILTRLAIGAPTMPTDRAGGPRLSAVEARLGEIAAMTPRDIALGSKRVRYGAMKVWEAAKDLDDRDLRLAVGSLLGNPAPSFLGATSSFIGFQAASGGGWDGHHAYPGGLAVHTWVNLRHAWALAGIYVDEYGMAVDQELLTAAVICHDVLKSWTNQFWPKWDESTGRFHTPVQVSSGGPYAAWGSYGLMGHHNALVAAELMNRKAPPRLVFASISHVDQALDTRTNGPKRATDETWERTIEDAFDWLESVKPGSTGIYRSLYLAGKWRSLEAGINFLADADWNLTLGRAMPLATGAFDRFATQYGLKTGTRAHGMARNWAYAHTDPMQLAAAAATKGIGEAHALIERTFQ